MVGEPADELTLDNVDSFEGLLDLLKRLRVEAGNASYRELEKKAEKLKRPLPHSTISDVLRGNSPLKLDFVKTFVEVCGASEQMDAWVAAWRRAARRHAPEGRLPSPRQGRERDLQRQLEAAQARLDELDDAHQRLEETHKTLVLEREELRQAHDLAVQAHLTTLSTMAKIAEQSEPDGLAAAVQLYEHVYLTRTALLGQVHPDTLTAGNNLAAAQVDLAQALVGEEHLEEAQRLYDEAEHLHEQVLARRRHVLSPDHPDTLHSMENLATAWAHQGRIDAACRLLKQVISARRSVLGDNHPDTAYAIEALRTLQAG